MVVVTKINDENLSIGKLSLHEHDKGYVCVLPEREQEVEITKGFFRKKREKRLIQEGVYWLENRDQPAIWFALDTKDKELLRQNEFLIQGDVYNITWLKGDRAQEVFDKYFDWAEPKD